MRWNGKTQTGLQEIFWLPGVGDHGGGPTRDMLEVAHKWNSSPFFPQVQFSTAVDYLDRIAKSDRQDGDYLTQRRRGAEAGQQDRGSQFPIWQNELYLELHRGCYTVRAEQKRFNRRCERLLYAAELWSTLAEVICQDDFISLIVAGISSMAIPEVTDLENVNAQQIIDLAWKKVLFNQFHDILPGTSIPEVFTEANRDWEKANRPRRMLPTNCPQSDLNSNRATRTTRCKCQSDSCVQFSQLATQRTSIDRD